MAHWIIEDKGFGGSFYRCSKCRDSFCDLFNDPGSWERCKSCGALMDEENEYIDEPKKEPVNDKLIVEYEEFPEDNVKVLSVIREEDDEVISMCEGDLAKFIYEILKGERIVTLQKTNAVLFEE